MKLNPALLAVALLGGLLSLAHAQLGKPIDMTKQADVNGKNVSFNNLQFNTISEPSPDLPREAPLMKGDLKLQNTEIQEKSKDLKTLQMPAFTAPILPQSNLPDKRAAADDKQSPDTAKLADETKQKAPITNRQIRAFTPNGEEELKKQLKDPHSAAQ